VVEFNNPASLGSLNFFDKIMAAYFQSVTLANCRILNAEYRRFISGIAVDDDGIYVYRRFSGWYSRWYQDDDFALVVLMVIGGNSES
jgi:hypothetical protein